jgi:hypothetical protein
MSPTSKTDVPEEPYGVVYFIGHGSSGPVKVGFTANRDVTQRLRQLQIGTPEPLEVLGTVLAYPSIERTIQVFLRPHSIRGEWFEREPALMILRRLEVTDNSHRSSLVEELQCLIVQNPQLSPEEEAEESLAVRVAGDILHDLRHELSSVNTERPLPFRAWLSAQNHRKDPTGDLARDAQKDPRFPAIGSLRDYLTFITERSTYAAVTRTVIHAWIECDLAVSRLAYRDQDVLDWDKDT